MKKYTLIELSKKFGVYLGTIRNWIRDGKLKVKKKKKEIVIVCLKCGMKYGTKKPYQFGIWIGTCDICHKKNVSCADASHDFGIYHDDKIRITDKLNIYYE